MRITASMDDKTYNTLKELRESGGGSKSKTIRDAIKFYSKYRSGGLDSKKTDLYMEMLSSGEHIILDVDHWAMFLRILDGSMSPEEFWAAHEDIARSHAEQFSGNLENIEDVLKRLEACNLFKLRKASGSEFTLILGSAPSKKFIKILLKTVLEGLGFEIKIQEDFSKLRIIA